MTELVQGRPGRKDVAGFPPEVWGGRQDSTRVLQISEVVALCLWFVGGEGNKIGTNHLPEFNQGSA